MQRVNLVFYSLYSLIYGSIIVACTAYLNYSVALFIGGNYDSETDNIKGIFALTVFLCLGVYLILYKFTTKYSSRKYSRAYYITTLILILFISYAVYFNLFFDVGDWKIPYYIFR